MLMICKQRTISKGYLQSQALYKSRKVLYVQNATGDASSIYKSVQGTYAMNFIHVYIIHCYVIIIINVHDSMIQYCIILQIVLAV